MKLIRAGLIALAVAGVFAIPVQEAEAEAAAKCKVTTVDGRVVKKVCKTKETKKPAYRTVCKTYWDHGVKHRKCRRVYN